MSVVICLISDGVRIQTQARSPAKVWKHFPQYQDTIEAKQAGPWIPTQVCFSATSY